MVKSGRLAGRPNDGFYLSDGYKYQTFVTPDEMKLGKVWVGILGWHKDHEFKANYLVFRTRQIEIDLDSTLVPEVAPGPEFALDDRVAGGDPRPSMTDSANQRKRRAADRSAARRFGSGHLEIVTISSTITTL